MKQFRLCYLNGLKSIRIALTKKSFFTTEMARLSWNTEQLLNAISKGKRIRAVLALLWCEALSDDYRRAAPVAVAYELAHAAALVQDDIIDNSYLRRGEKSIVGKYGISGAILTSNTLLFQVPNLIAECGRRGSDSTTLCSLLDLLGDCYRSATLGEFLDSRNGRSSSRFRSPVL